MRIAVVSTFDADNIKTWSGTSYNIISRLRKQNEVDVFEIKLKRTWLSFVRSIWYNRVAKKVYYSDYDTSLQKKNSKQINERLKKEYDIILSFEFFLLPFLKKAKKVLITDATFDNMVNYYEYMSNLSNFNIKEGNSLFNECISKNHITVFASDWARNNAIQKYNGDGEKLFTIPLGANLGYIPSNSEVEKWVELKSSSTICRILFLGAFWERKGGNDALDIIRHLSSLGVVCTMTVVGCNPEIPGDLKDIIDVVGFLRKDNEEENNRLNYILQTSHVLLLPSLAECFGCVYCEANAYGLPVIGRDTGGVGTIIKDGVNGLLLGKNETNRQLAIRWKELFTDTEKYKVMSYNSRKEYDQRLNYQVFCDDLMKVLAIEN